MRRPLHERLVPEDLSPFVQVNPYDEIAIDRILEADSVEIKGYEEECT